MGVLLGSSVGRNLGLVVALIILCLVGIATAGEQFASIDNALTILRLAAVIGVVSVGMTFVITGGGIDLSVGAIVALSSVWCDHPGHPVAGAGQPLDGDRARRAPRRPGLRADQRPADRLRQGGPLHRHAGDAGRCPGPRRDHRPAPHPDRDVPGFTDFFRTDVLGIPLLVVIFALVAVVGWVVLNRTTFGRRTFAVGGNPEAARLAGINVKRHTVALYAIVGLCCGIAAVMIVARTTTGSSTHGTLYELDAIAAVVIGGTLLSGGRGTIVGTVLGVLIFTTLSNVFTQNNLSSSAQSVAKGLIIVVAVLLQQRLASRSNSGSP